MPGFISAQDLDALVQKGDDASFVIVDVRKEGEYRLDHIPGAVNVPVDQVETCALLHNALRVIFYCRNGMRSKVAAILAVDAGIDDRRVSSLHGGMTAYTGEIVLDLPGIALFDPPCHLATALARAIELEKGAWRFYVQAGNLCASDARVADFFAGMAGFETAHAGALFDRLRDCSGQPGTFQDYFDACKGDLLEGGRSLDEILVQLTAGRDVSRILDLALDIEVAAYDLYKRTSAVFLGDLRPFFLDLARAEKGHMKKILRFVDAWESHSQGT